MWYCANQAEIMLDALSKGYDPEDTKLGPSELKSKYSGDVLAKKSLSFRSLPIEKQRDLLYSAVTGKETDTSREVNEASAHGLIVQRVVFFFKKLKEIGKEDHWIKSSCDLKTFIILPLEEKKNYYNALAKFMDEQMKISGQPHAPKKDRVLDSSPTGPIGCPDFNDLSQWERLDD